MLASFVFEIKEVTTLDQSRGTDPDWEEIYDGTRELFEAFEGVNGIEFSWSPSEEFENGSIVYVRASALDEAEPQNEIETSYWFTINKLNWIEQLQLPENAELLEELKEDETWEDWFEAEKKKTDPEELSVILSNCMVTGWFKNLMKDEEFRNWFEIRSSFTVTREFLEELLRRGQERVYLDYLKARTYTSKYKYPYPVDCYHTTVRNWIDED
jgi:hypothetical protein